MVSPCSPLLPPLTRSGEGGEAAALEGGGGCFAFAGKEKKKRIPLQEAHICNSDCCNFCAQDKQICFFLRVNPAEGNLRDDWPLSLKGSR